MTTIREITDDVNINRLRDIGHAVGLSGQFAYDDILPRVKALVLIEPKPVGLIRDALEAFEAEKWRQLKNLVTNYTFANKTNLDIVVDVREMSAIINRINQVRKELGQDTY